MLRMAGVFLVLSFVNGAWIPEELDHSEVVSRG
jgi:hypothetical protein